MNNMKVINAQQARIIHHYKNTHTHTHTHKKSLKLMQQQGVMECADSNI